MTGSVPNIRVTAVNDQEIRPDRAFVLYWMTAFRRTHYNFSLQRATDWSRELQKPLLILEALRSDYRWSSERLHRFVLDGMRDNRQSLQERPVTYYPFVETERKGGKGLLEALAGRACVVVSDDYPCFFLPRMIESAGSRLGVRLEKIDSNGILPLRAADRVYLRAYDFRRFLQKSLREHLAHFPLADPLGGADFPGPAEIPAECRKRWAAAGSDLLERSGAAWRKIPLREEVLATEEEGGAVGGRKALQRFLDLRLSRYAEERNQPERQATSGLSPYLHFGHVSSHEVLKRLLEGEGVEPVSLRPGKVGKRESWWEISPGAQEFSDQLLTWRELGFNLCWQREDYMEYESLPEWARETLEEHAGDPREPCYSRKEFEAAQTHDELWNAAQRQLLREGRIHHYMRMVWGKKILQWSESPREAARIMIALNDKYALDGRDPNSYSGIFWCLGRYDRAWGPERPIFGKIRYMSSQNTARKFSVGKYLEKYRAG